MEIHYFQRYYQEENVATANMMLLLSRLYSFSPDKFFQFLSANILQENETIDLDLSFKLQEKSKNSIPDATIEQPSFKIVVETKLNSNFNINQLTNHLKSFNDEKYKILLTVDPREIKGNINTQIKEEINKYDKTIIHRHLTFESIIDGIRDVIEDRDYEIIKILDDYQKYCFDEELITDDEQRMRVVLSGQSFGINKKLNLYYTWNKNFSGHKYLGLYKDKSVKAIGKIIFSVVASYENEELKVKDVCGNNNQEIDNETKDKILQAIKEGNKMGHDLTKETRYSFVDKFYDTDFKKDTPYAPMGARYFNLCKVLEREDLPSSTEEIAELLSHKTWK